MHMHDKTPEERKAMAAKGLVTRRANKAKAILADEVRAKYAGELGAKIAYMEAQMINTGHRLEIHQLAALSKKTLLREEELVSAALPWDEPIGVYFLVQDHRVVYVGQSVNILTRIREHRASKVFNRFAYVACTKDELDFLESLYIHYLRPKYNGEVNGHVFAPLQLHQLRRVGR
jgi:hypothetical protein